MKKHFLLYTLLAGFTLLAAHVVVAGEKAPRKKDLSGAWSGTQTINGQQVKHSLIMTEGYFSLATYAAEGGAFLSTVGGKYTATDNSLTVTLEFNTSDPSTVGQSNTLYLKETEKGFTVNSSDGSISYSFENVDKGKPGKLAGAWLISGRKGENGEISKRDTNVPRKTMKILSGTRFQWIAYNTETGEFFGTGGGTYTTENGKYAEKIEFFSRDNSRVGATLEFDFDLKDKDWHHSGLSSKGDPIYEVWSMR